MQYDLMHLSVLRRSEGPLLDRLQDESTIPTREAWLRSIFTKAIPFDHRGGRFHYAPASGGIDPQIVTGRIGRHTAITENAPPEENLNEITRPQWLASVVLIDPRHHDQGQKVAMEEKQKVGGPLPLFRSLAAKINSSDPPEPYLLQVSNIAEEATFWTFVNQNRGQITEASFELIAPNMFAQDTDFDEEMKELRDQVKIQKMRFDLQSDEGLNLNTKRVEDTAAYAAKGGGVIKAKTRSGKRFNSTRKSKKVSVSAPLKARAGQIGETMADWVRRSIGTIFGT
jgi:hypothetical protein